MRRSLVFSVLVMIFTMFATRAGADATSPLVPARPWVLGFDETECLAERAYGGPNGLITLGIRPALNGESYELLVARSGRGPALAVQRSGSVAFGSKLVPAWLVHFDHRTSGVSIQKFRVAAGDIPASGAIDTVTFKVRGGPDVQFAMRSMPQVMSGLQQCLGMLRKHWNMDEAGSARIATPASGDVRHLFNWKDYPDEAFNRQQEGMAQFVLLIDEKGGVANCDVLKTSGIPVLEVRGCQVIRERGKFMPARDADGKAIRSSVVTPPVHWRLAG